MPISHTTARLLEMDRQSWADFLATDTTLGQLDAETRQALASELEVVTLKRGEPLFYQGDVGDSLAALVSGRLAVSIENKQQGVVVVDEVEPGQMIGEASLLTQQPRSASVYATMESQLVRLTKAGFERVAQKHPQIAANLSTNLLPRFRQRQLLDILNALFGKLDQAVLLDLRGRLEWLQLTPGETLLRQGDESDALYIIVHGRLRISVDVGEGESRIVREVGVGETVGETDLLTNTPRTATATAIRGVTAVKLSSTVYEQLMSDHPQAMAPLARIIAGRQVGIRQPQVNKPTTLTFTLASGDPNTPLRLFAQKLYEQLSAFGETLYLNSERFDRMFGKAGAAQTSTTEALHLPIASWLANQEDRYRYVIMETDSTWSGWTQRCVQQADRILLVRQANGDPAPDAIEQAIVAQQPFARCDLVLLQPEPTQRPSQTSRWLNPRNATAHYHLRLDNPDDWGRMVRRLTGRAIGLVLAGGGARGLSHVGVVRALLEAKVPIDLVGGTSAGGLVAGVYAIYPEFEHFAKIVSEGLIPKNTRQYTLPLLSLLTSAYSTAYVKKHAGDVEFEDTWLPNFCVSTNLTKATLMLHSRGPIGAAVRASMAMPGIFPPMLHNGDVLVDGGIMNNFPADVMRQLMGPGTIIGVNLSPTVDKVKTYNFKPDTTGWQILWSRLNPFAKTIRAPSMMGVMMRAMEMHNAHTMHTAQNEVDLLIVPELKGYRINDYDKGKELQALGYEAGVKALAGWKRPA